MTRNATQLATLLFVLASASGCAGKKPTGVWHYPEDRYGKVRVYQIGTNRRADQLIKWTNHYAEKMGLVKRQPPGFMDEYPHVIFQPLPNGWCGFAFMQPPNGIIVAFNLTSRCNLSWNPRALALHEMCHHRLGHVARFAADSSLDTHGEVEKCMTHYW